VSGLQQRHFVQWNPPVVFHMKPFLKVQGEGSPAILPCY